MFVRSFVTVLRVSGIYVKVLVTSNFDDDSINNERPSMETEFSSYKYMEIFSSRTANSI